MRPNAWHHAARWRWRCCGRAAFVEAKIVEKAEAWLARNEALNARPSSSIHRYTSTFLNKESSNACMARAINAEIGWRHFVCMTDKRSGAATAKSTMGIEHHNSQRTKIINPSSAALLREMKSSSRTHKNRAKLSSAAMRMYNIKAYALWGKSQHERRVFIER